MTLNKKFIPHIKVLIIYSNYVILPTSFPVFECHSSTIAPPSRGKRAAKPLPFSRKGPDDSFTPAQQVNPF